MFVVVKTCGIYIYILLLDTLLVLQVEGTFTKYGYGFKFISGLENWLFR